MKPKRPKHSQTRKKAVAAGFRSGLEAAIAADLTEKGIKFTYEQRQISYLLPVRAGKCGDCGSATVGRRAIYTPDFEINGRFLVESKGYFTARDRSKLAAVRAQHPALDLRVLFGADNWTTKLHKQRYSEWAHKHGFKWAVGKRIPETWLAGV